MLLHFWHVAEVRPWHIALPFSLAILVGLVEGASFSLLIPLSDGVASGNFGFLETSRGFGWVIDTLPRQLRDSPRRDTAIAVLLLGLLLVGTFLKVGFEYGRAWFLSGRNERYLVRAREETFGRVARFGQLYFDRQSLGHVDTEISWSSSVVDLLSALEGLVMNAVRLAVKVALVLVISPLLFASLLVSLSLLALLNRRISARAEGLAKEAATIEKGVRREVLDLLSTMPLVKIHHQEEQVRSTYRALLDKAETVGVSRWRLAHVEYRLDEAIVLFGALVTEGLILVFVPGSPALHLARFCVFFLVAQQCVPDLNGFSKNRLAVIERGPLLRALARLFRDEDKLIVPSGSRPFLRVENEIEVRDLRFHYEPGTEVLRGVNALFPAGCLTVLVGERGSGKTTLADLLARLYDPDPGSILVDGVDIREFELRSFHRRVALVSQDVWLLNRTLRDNLTFGLEEPLSDDVLWDALKDVALNDFFETLPAGLSTELGTRGVRLSGGQKQRVALARTLIRDPDLIILDEATAALDGVLERQVIRTFRERFRGRTLIVIAHRLSTITNADRIMVMDSGRIVESGTWDELSARGGPFSVLLDAQVLGAIPVGD